jgi:sterol 14-demethylase
MAKTPPVVSGGLPVLGHALEFRNERNGLFQRGLAEHGDIFSIRMGRQEAAVLLGPDHHQTFFMETDKALNMDKPYRFLKAMFGEVAFTASKEVYQEQRPILHYPFRRQKMIHYVTIMQQVVQGWLDGLDDEGEMELTEEINWLVQQVAGYCFMGPDFMQQVGREFWDLYTVLNAGLDPLIPPDWPLPKFRRRDQAKAEMEAILRPVIVERRRNPDNYDDFLQDFVNQRYKDGREVEDETIITLILGLMFAGHETTAGQAGWLVIFLLQHPQYRALVEKEIAATIAPGTEIDLKILAQLQHVEWAAREIERMRPSADLLMRAVEEDLPVGDYVLPAGWLALVAAGIAHQMPAVFPDPDRFDPLRYAPDRAEDKQHRFALIGFGGGVHKCTGMNFAYNEMMILTSLLFQQFELELVTKDPQIQYGLGANRPEKTVVRYRRRPVPLGEPPIEIGEKQGYQNLKIANGDTHATT